MPGRFLRSALLIFFSLTALIHFYFNRTTLNPHYGKVFYKLGLECQDRCSLNKQLFYFQKAVFYDPNLTDAYYRLGIIYGRNGQHKEKIESYRKVTQLDHFNGEAYFQIGFDHFQKGEFDYAIRYFLQSDRYKSNAHDVFYYLAKTYDSKGMYKEAVYYYVTLIIWGSPRSGEICERVWAISKIPDQLEMVTTQLRVLFGPYQQDLWKQIDQYLITDQMPEFMRKPMETGHD